MACAGAFPRGCMLAPPKSLSGRPQAHCTRPDALFCFRLATAAWAFDAFSNPPTSSSEHEVTLAARLPHKMYAYGPSLALVGAAAIHLLFASLPFSGLVYITSVHSGILCAFRRDPPKTKKRTVHDTTRRYHRTNVPARSASRMFLLTPAAISSCSLVIFSGASAASLPLIATPPHPPSPSAE